MSAQYVKIRRVCKFRFCTRVPEARVRIGCVCNKLHTLRLTSIILTIIGISSAQAAEPFRLVLTDVEQNIYKEAVNLTSSEVTPDCPVAWSVKKYILHGGKQEGVEVVEVNNGKLRFDVVPTRGMSIQQVTMGNLRLGWDSPVKGLVHPKFINLNNRQGLGWLEGFNEWMVRCGLEFFGAPGTDEFTDNTGKKSAMDLTLHGKICNTPASMVEIVIEREKPYRIAVRGRVDETLLHGPKLDILTQVSTVPGTSELQISDKVTNHSAVEQEFGILYHGNYGPPLMEKGARFFGPVRQVTPINEHAAADVSDYDKYTDAKAGVPEQVYCLQLWADENGRTKVMLRNAAGDKAVSTAFSVKELPFFTLWKNPVAQEDGYVTGLEPGTGFPRNRSIERKFGRVPKLGPHESRSFTIDFALHTSEKEINALANEIAGIWAGRPTQVDKSPRLSTGPGLGDIIKAAKTWGPAFKQWYGKPAPDFTLNDIAGKEHKLSDYRGKNVLIVFWATWCGPCKIEIPHLIELRKTVSEDDLAILAISNENPGVVKKFVAEAKMNYTILLDPGILPGPYNSINAIPSSFFIDSSGKIKLGSTGLVSLEEIKAIFQAE
jgi:peroxiredoxin